MAKPRKTIRRFSLQAFFLLALAIALPLLILVSMTQTPKAPKASEAGTTPSFTITVSEVPTSVPMSQPVALTLRVTNHEGYDGKASSGFVTGAAFIDPQTQNYVTSAGGTYNGTTGIWSIKLPAPSTVKPYQLEIWAECGNSLGWCAQTYGQAKKVKESHSVTVRKFINVSPISGDTCLRMMCPNGQKAVLRSGKCSCQPATSTQ